MYSCLFGRLIGLKNIFSKQLPNMPKEYIARLVLDRRHRSVALLRRGGGEVLGGITYRAFHRQGFGEIAFCAITASEQARRAAQLPVTCQRGPTCFMFSVLLL
jgi:hypothetical protein